MNDLPDPDPSEGAFASGSTDGERPIAHSTATLVGRTGELEELISGLDSALAGRGCLFLISGEPGIGILTLINSTGSSSSARLP